MPTIYHHSPVPRGHKKACAPYQACRYAFAKLKHTIIGGDTRSGRALEELNKVTTKIYRISKQQSIPGATLDLDLMEKAMTHRSDAKKYFMETIENLETGKELEDFVKYESKECRRVD